MRISLVLIMRTLLFISLLSLGATPDFSTSLSGNWKAHTKCCSDVRRIRARMRPNSDTTYRFSTHIAGVASDYAPSGIVTIYGQQIVAKLTSRLNTSGSWSGTIAADGQSFTVVENSGCTYTFRR